MRLVRDLHLAPVEAAEPEPVLAGRVMGIWACSRGRQVSQGQVSHYACPLLGLTSFGDEKEFFDRVGDAQISAQDNHSRHRLAETDELSGETDQCLDIVSQ
jgi:hypothetical protein